jgi:hypothetical protein
MIEGVTGRWPAPLRPWMAASPHRIDGSDCWETAPGDVQQRERLFLRSFLPSPALAHLRSGGLGCSRRAAGDPARLSSATTTS